MLLGQAIAILAECGGVHLKTPAFRVLRCQRTKPLASLSYMMWCCLKIWTLSVPSLVGEPSESLQQKHIFSKSQAIVLAVDVIYKDKNHAILSVRWGIRLHVHHQLAGQCKSWKAGLRLYVAILSSVLYAHLYHVSFRNVLSWAGMLSARALALQVWTLWFDS